jgi:hypothetical protein
MSRIEVEVCDLAAYLSAEGDRVDLEVPGAGVTLSLSPLAAHNLAVELPGLADQAASGTIADAVAYMGRRRRG